MIDLGKQTFDGAPGCGDSSNPLGWSDRARRARGDDRDRPSM